jgi:hypothetical protein
MALAISMEDVQCAMLEQEGAAISRGESVMLHKDVSPFIYISAGIDIQELQYVALFDFI